MVAETCLCRFLAPTNAPIRINHPDTFSASFLPKNAPNHHTPALHRPGVSCFVRRQRQCRRIRPPRPPRQLGSVSVGIRHTTVLGGRPSERQLGPARPGRSGRNTPPPRLTAKSPRRHQPHRGNRPVVFLFPDWTAPSAVVSVRCRVRGLGGTQATVLDIRTPPPHTPGTPHAPFRAGRNRT